MRLGPRIRALALLGLAAVLPACASQPGIRPSVSPTPPARHLEIRFDPAGPTHLAPGDMVQIAVLPVPDGEMQWVSGTVQLFHAPTLAFKQDAKDRLFKFKTMVPPMANIPAGTYEVKVWGRSLLGESLQGSSSYEVR
jgi:hypothetical protein